MENSKNISSSSQNSTEKKKKWLSRWGKKTTLNLWLTVCVLLMITVITIGVLSKVDNPLRRLYHLAESNLVIALGFVIWVVIIYFWAANRTVTTERGLLISKIYIILSIALYGFFLFYRAPLDYSLMEKERLKAIAKQKVDSITNALRLDDKRLSVVAEKKLTEAKKKISLLEHQIDSIAIVNLDLKQRDNSRELVVSSLKKTNTFLDSVNKALNQPIIVTTNTVTPVPVEEKNTITKQDKKVVINKISTTRECKPKVTTTGSWTKVPQKKHRY